MTVAAVVADGRGVRPVAADADVPHTTARDWVRRFPSPGRGGGRRLRAPVVELVGRAPLVSTRTTVADHALGLVRLAFRAVRARAGPTLRSLWAFVATVTGGASLATTTNPLSIVLGGRRLIPPAP